MNSIERVQAAIDLRPPDRIPVDLHNFQPAAFAMGGSMSDVFQNGELLAEAMLHGVARVRARHDPAGERHGLQRAGVRRAGHLSRRRRACRAHPGDHPAGGCGQARSARSRTPRSRCARSSRRPASWRRRSATRSGSAAGPTRGPMDLASQLFGMEPLMLEIATGEKAGLVALPARLCPRGGDPLCDRPDRERRALDLDRRAGRRARRDVAAPLPQVCAAAGEADGGRPEGAGHLLHNHICGNTIPIINDFVATGAQVLEIDHKTDLAKAQGGRPGQDLPPRARSTRRPARHRARRRRSTTPVGRRSRSWRPDGGLHPGPGLRARSGDAGREHPRAGRSCGQVRRAYIRGE